MSNHNMLSDVEEAPEKPGTRSFWRSCWIVLFIMVLIALVAVGTIASQGKLSRGKNRVELPGGGTVELSEVIFARQITYRSGNWMEKQIRKLPRPILSWLPSSWRRGGASLSLGSSGSGPSAAVVLTFRNANRDQRKLTVHDGQAWRQMGHHVGSLTAGGGELINIYSLGLLPHKQPELQLRLLEGTREPLNEVAKYKIANPFYNNPAPGTITPPALKDESSDGDLNFKVRDVICNAVRDDTSTGTSAKLRPAKPDEIGYTWMTVDVKRNGATTKDFLPGYAQLQDSYGGSIWSGADTDQMPNHLLVKLQNNLYAGEHPFKIQLDFYHSNNLTDDEKWSVSVDLPTTGLESIDRPTTSVGSGHIIASLCGKEFREPQASWITTPPDEYWVRLESPPVSGYRTEFIDAKTSDGRVMPKTFYQNSYSRASRTPAGSGGYTRMWTIRDPETPRGQVATATGPTSVTLNFTILKARKAEFVVQPKELPK